MLDFSDSQNYPFQTASQSNVDENSDVDPEMMQYWTNGLIDPQRDAVYERFFRLAHNCYRYVTTFEAYRDTFPERFNNDENNAEILRRAQISAVFYACENIVGVVVSYYQVLNNDRHPLPRYVRDTYGT